MTVVQSLFRLKKGKHINLKTNGNKSACKHDTQEKAIVFLTNKAWEMLCQIKSKWLKPFHRSKMKVNECARQ